MFRSQLAFAILHLPIKQAAYSDGVYPTRTFPIDGPILQALAQAALEGFESRKAAAQLRPAMIKPAVFSDADLRAMEVAKLVLEQ
jgi:hypothetical protein